VVFEPEYEVDADAWDEAARFWHEEVSRLEAEAGQVGEWKSWESKTWGDGITTMPREYRSICEGRSYRLDRSFQILQDALVNGDSPIAAWVKDFEHDELWIKDEWPRLPRAVLVIALALTDQTADLARSLLRLWMQPETTAKSMQAFIDQTPAGEPAQTDSRSGGI
jgi:hypothetical protein